MSLIVVDACVGAKWFLQEDHSAAAGRLRAPHYQLAAPDFFLLEVDNVFVKRVRQGELKAMEAMGARKVLRQFPITYVPFALLQDHAYYLAQQTMRSLYDCLYLALAEEQDSRVVTADRRFYEQVSSGPLKRRMMWVEELV
jgi:predicted nucleic acid-binding protein